MTSSWLAMLRNLPREVRYAARTLARTPSFSAIAFLMIALGVGSTTAMFAVLDSVVLRPLPYADPARLVSVLQPTTVPGSGESKWGMSAAGYFEFRKETKALADLGGYRTTSLTVTGDGQNAEEVQVGQITASIVTTLGARPHIGRLLNTDDDRPGGPRNAVLGYTLWRNRYHGDESVLGRTIQTSVGPYTVVGVATPGFNLPKPGPFASTSDLAGFNIDFWTPLQLDPSAAPMNSHQYSGIGRLAPGATVEQAQAELAAVTARFPDLFPSAYSPGFMKQYNFRVGVTDLHTEVIGPTATRALWILFAAVGLVLIIACANVANLFIVRYESRGRESAIRSALGATRLQMAAHHLTESLLLTVTAGTCGALVAWWAVPALAAIAPRNLPLLASATMHMSAVMLAIALSVVAGLVFGAIPVMRRSAVLETLRASGRGLTASRAQRIVRAGLVVGQVSLAVVLLAAAGLLVRSVEALKRVQPGLDPSGVLAFEITLPFDRYDTLESALAFHHELQDKIAMFPGVVSVGATTALPLRDYGGGCTVVFREARPYTSNEQTPCVQTQRATPGFFESLSVTVRGRIPSWSDVDSRAQASVITKALADRMWPGEDPIGKGINSNGPSATVGFYRIVGVIPELRASGLDRSPTEAIFYAPTALTTPSKSGNVHDLVYTVKTQLSAPLTLVPSIRAAVTAINPQVPVVRPTLMQEVVDRSMARTSFIMLLLSIAAGMAMALSATGLYGVIAYVVAQRKPEIGIRIALGAQVGQIGRWVVGQSLALACAGVLAGLGLAWVATRALQSLLYGVSPADPVVLAISVVTLIVVAFAASLAPARRAARIDPVDAIKT